MPKTRRPRSERRSAVLLGFVTLLVGGAALSAVPWLRVVLAFVALLLIWGVFVSQLRSRAVWMERALYDPLTGFYRRWYFDIRLRQEVERALRSRERLVLAVIDLDGLKRLNDTEGHRAGDRLLTTFARAVRATVRATDLIFRYGGDEFVLLLPHTHLAGAEELLSRLQAASDVAWSAGVAEYPSEAMSGEELFRLADSRLLRAKAARSAGRGTG
jgi:two-component system cell cycle response regulator